MSATGVPASAVNVHSSRLVLEDAGERREIDADAVARRRWSAGFERPATGRSRGRSLADARRRA